MIHGIKRNIKAFVQSAKDSIRTGSYTMRMEFSIDKEIELMHKRKSHKAFVENSKTNIDTAKPTKFTYRGKWDDWKAIFLNILRLVPGISCVFIK